MPRGGAPQKRQRKSSRSSVCELSTVLEFATTLGFCIYATRTSQGALFLCFGERRLSSSAHLLTTAARQPVSPIMNLLLSDDYLLQDYPESITSTIRSGHATFLRFNRKGDYLASGRVDGTVAVWDLETMGVARKLRGHNKSITFLSWSRCGRYLLSACQGWRAILWDLKDGSRFREVRFRAPVYMAELHPTNRLVTCVLRHVRD